jgi:hypothetical protein
MRLAMRWLLVAILVHGFVPGLAEAAEAVVHLARTGHAAHTAADQGDLGDQGPEHGCGTTQHHCTCCAAQVVVPAPEVVVATAEHVRSPTVRPAERVPATREPARPFRPPIA